MNDREKYSIYKKYVENGRIWYSIDKSKEPKEDERKVILELSQREQKKNAEFELHRKKIEQYFKNNPNKKLYFNFPKTFFDIDSY